MVEISLSGSGEGPGWVTGRGYSTAVVRETARVASASDKHPKRVPIPSTWAPWVNSHTRRTQVACAWLRALRRRSQRHRMPWERFNRLVARWLPTPRMLHEYVNVRFFAMHPT